MFEHRVNVLDIWRQIIYFRIYNFIEDFVRVIVSFSQLLVFIGDIVAVGESCPLPFKFFWQDK